MKVGNLVLAPFERVELEPRLYRIEAISQGKANLRLVSITDGVLSQEQRQVSVFDLRTWRVLTAEAQEDLKQGVIQLRHQRSYVRDVIRALPLVADVS